VSQSSTPTTSCVWRAGSARRTLKLRRKRLAFKGQWSSGDGHCAMSGLGQEGRMHSLGAVVYARKRPNPSPRWFGFHEVFHALTVLAWLAQYASVSLVVYRAA
jgi:predicted membrane channel-forming protein YqfA (hemolysin III family)